MPDSAGVMHTFCYVKNLKEDIVGMTDDKGNMVVEYRYDAWGNKTESFTTSYSKIPNLDKVNTRQYSSYWNDESLGLYFMKTRMYDPTIGRFLSKDQISSGSTPLSLNPYIYCANNPTGFVDPSGKFFWSPIFALAGGGTMGSAATTGVILGGPVVWAWMGVAVVAGVLAYSLYKSYADSISLTSTSTGVQSTSITGSTSAGSSSSPSNNNNNKNKNKKDTSKNYKNKPNPKPSTNVDKIETAKVDPASIARNINRFFKNAGNKAFDKIIEIKNSDVIKLTYTIPGYSGGEARAVYTKIIDMGGNTLLFYKNSFNSAGDFVSSKIKYIINIQ